MTDPYADTYAAYWANGWRGILPLPPNRKTSPPAGTTGRDGTDPSWPDCVAWAETGPNNIALRLPAGIIGIDVDDYDGKNGGSTLARLVEQHGALPATWLSTSRDDGISGIRLYKIPPGTELLGGLPGIEIIQHHHRYIVCHPSTHPSGRTYQWVDERTGETDVLPAIGSVPDLPAPWVQALQQPAGQHTKDTAADLRQIWVQLPAGEPCTHIRTAAGHVFNGNARHDSYNHAVLAILGHARRGCPGAHTIIPRLYSAFLAETTGPGDGQRTRGEAEGEWQRNLAGALAIIAGEPQGSVCTDQLGTYEPDWTQPAQPRPDPDNGAPPRTSWWPVPLEPILGGDDPEPDPTELARSDGKHIFYPGKVNGLLGESESGKTWIALMAAVQAINENRNVTYLDFEDTAPGIISRLQAMGAQPNKIAEHLHYIGPDETLGQQSHADLKESLTQHQPAIIILDGFNAAMTLLGLELNDNTDATTFAQRLLKPLAATGAAVIYIDHIPKNGNGSKGGIGAQSKRAMTTGAALKVEIVTTFGRGQTGKLRLTVDKDRPGKVRGLAHQSKLIGHATITSTGDDVTITLDPPAEQAKPFRPTTIMRKITTLLTRIDGREATKSQIAKNLPHKREHVFAGIDALVAEGHLKIRHGARNSLNYQLVKPFMEDE